MAFDKTDGRIAWTAGQWRASYASPIPAVVHGKRRILVFAGGDIPVGTPQNETEATKAPKLRKPDGLIDFDQPAAQHLGQRVVHVAAAIEQRQLGGESRVRSGPDDDDVE